MDTKQFTEKVVSLLNAAQQLASEQSHQQITPLHVAVAMFEDAEGVAPAALRKVALGPEALASVLRTLRKQLVRLPAVQGDAGGDVYISSDLKRALQAAQKLQKQQGDSFLGGWPAGRRRKRVPGAGAARRGSGRAAEAVLGCALAASTQPCTREHVLALAQPRTLPLPQPHQAPTSSSWLCWRPRTCRRRWRRRA